MLGEVSIIEKLEALRYKLIDYRFELAKEFGLGWYDLDTKCDNNGFCHEIEELKKVQTNLNDPRRPTMAQFKINEAVKRTYPQMFKKTLGIAKTQKNIRLLPIIQPDGKIRVATINNASTQLISRAMTAFLMPYLKNFAITRDVLRDRDVKLQNHDARELLIYSADLSKSTDPISIDLARFVLKEVVRHTGKPEWWDDAVEAVIKGFEFDSCDGGKTTTCGAMMGLGPGWTVLNILNSFAATKAGAPQNSFKICGDDLIGLWPEVICDAYEQNIASLGLESNKSKSFRSYKGGVFCERHVIRTERYTARAKTCTRIGEAIGSRAEEKGVGLMVVDHLRSLRGHRVLRKAAERAADRHSFEVGCPGPLHLGGNGSGTANHTTLISYIVFGPTPVSRVENDERIRKLRVAVRELPFDPVGPTTAADLIIHGMSEIEMEKRCEGQLGARPKLMSRAAVQNILLRRQAHVHKLLRRGGPIGVVNKLSAGLVGRPLWTGILRKLKNAVRHRHYCQAIRIVKGSWDKKISGKDLSQLYLEIFPKHSPGILSNYRPAPEAWDSRASS
jgi:hypothetical protein